MKQGLLGDLQGGPGEALEVPTWRQKHPEDDKDAQKAATARSRGSPTSSLRSVFLLVLVSDGLELKSRRNGPEPTEHTTDFKTRVVFGEKLEDVCVKGAEF